MCLQSWDIVANPVNIKSGFRCSGIIPVDHKIFGENEFLSSAVTDLPIIEHMDAAPISTTMVSSVTSNYINMPSTSSATHMSYSCSVIRTLTPPETMGAYLLQLPWRQKIRHSHVMCHRIILQS